MVPLARPVTVSVWVLSTFWASVVRVPSGRQNQKLYRAAPAKNPRNEMVLSVTVSPTRLSPPVNPVPAGFGCAHGALDGFGGGRTRTVTVSAALSCTPSLTTSENARSSRTDGAVNVGRCAVALLSVTVGPPVCVHR